jgi:translation initiation factor 3 subunit I
MKMVVNVGLSYFLALIIETTDAIATIPTQESKATVAGWSFLDKYIIIGHENGMVSQWNWKVCPFEKFN